MKNFMLGSRFNVREKAIQYSLKTFEVVLDADGHVLTYV